MKLLYIHTSEKYKSDTEGNLYTDGTYNENVWLRYKSIAGEITVLFRRDNNEYSKGYASMHFNKIDLETIKVETHVDCKKSIFSYVIRGLLISRMDELFNLIEKHDGVIVRLPCEQGLLSIKIAKMLNKPIIVEVVGCAWDTLWNHSLQGKLLAPIKHREMKKAVKLAPYVIYVTENYLQKKYPTDGIAISCSDVFIGNIDHVLTNRIVKQEAKRLVIGTIGSLGVKYKGQKLVIEAIRRLTKKGYILEYQMVGSGDPTILAEDAKNKGLRNSTVFLGTMAHEQVLSWLDNVDIYIQPSLAEGLPRALLEAMSKQCICLGSDVGGIPEILPSSNIFRKGNVRSLEKTLEKAIIRGKETVQITYQNSLRFSGSKYEKKRLDFMKGVFNEASTGQTRK